MGWDSRGDQRPGGHPLGHDPRLGGLSSWAWARKRSAGPVTALTAATAAVAALMADSLGEPAVVGYDASQEREAGDRDRTGLLILDRAIPTPSDSWPSRRSSGPGPPMGAEGSARHLAGRRQIRTAGWRASPVRLSPCVAATSEPPSSAAHR